MTPTQQLPFVSVIMPVLNEEDAITKSVSAVLSQDYPHERMELLVVDGLSNDKTRTRVHEIAKHDSRVHLVENKARLMAAGFNLGMSHAGGEVIVMLGGHTELSRNYVSRCVNVLLEKKADCVGGVIETLSDTKVGEAIALAMSSPFGVGGVGFRTGASREKYVDTVAFGAYTREIVNRAGLLDESFVRNQDDEYNYRIREIGGRILLLPDINCRYFSRPSLHALWTQYFRYGFWKVRVMQKHPLQMRPRHFAPALFVTALITSVGLAAFSQIGLWLLAFVAGSYFLANFGASILSARRLSWKSVPILPIAFAVLHLSYGLGFLFGLIVFWNRWTGRKGDLYLSAAK